MQLEDAFADRELINNCCLWGHIIAVAFTPDTPDAQNNNTHSFNDFAEHLLSSTFYDPDCTFLDRIVVNDDAPLPFQSLQTQP